MTDRVYALTVVLEKNNREDDVQRLADAIGMFAGVLAVEKNVADIALYTATERARGEFRTRLWKALEDE